MYQYKKLPHAPKNAADPHIVRRLSLYTVITSYPVFPITLLIALSPIMIYQNTASSALAATILLIQVSVSAAGHARAHLHAGHHHRARAVAGSMEVPMTELSMLQ